MLQGLNGGKLPENQTVDWVEGVSHDGEGMTRSEQGMTRVSWVWFAVVWVLAWRVFDFVPSGSAQLRALAPSFIYVGRLHG